MYILNTSSSFQITSPANTYIYDIVSIGSHVAAISSDDSLRILNPLALNGAPLSTVKKANADITCLNALETEGGGVVVCTAGRDGLVNLRDLRSGDEVVGSVRSGE